MPVNLEAFFSDHPDLLNKTSHSADTLIDESGFWSLLLHRLAIVALNKSILVQLDYSVKDLLTDPEIIPLLDEMIERSKLPDDKDNKLPKYLALGAIRFGIRLYQGNKDGTARQYDGKPMLVIEGSKSKKNNPLEVEPVKLMMSSTNGQVIQQLLEAQGNWVAIDGLMKKLNMSRKVVLRVTSIHTSILRPLHNPYKIIPIEIQSNNIGGNNYATHYRVQPHPQL